MPHHFAICASRRKHETRVSATLRRIAALHTSVLRGTLALGLVLTSALSPVSAQATASSGSLTVRGAWTRATAPGAAVAVGYLVIENQGAADRLVSLSTNAAERAELHTTRMEQGVMRMRQVPSLTLDAGAVLRLEPRGTHIMFIRPKQAFDTGNKVEVTLHFEHAAALTVNLPVVPLGRDGPPAPQDTPVAP